MVMLYKHQQNLINKNPEKCLLAWETGTGKSLAAIEWAKQNHGKNTLLICPKALREKWLRDIIVNGALALNPWIVHSKEDFRKRWKTMEKCEVVIVDEAHYFSGIKSDMSKALYNYIKKHKPKVLLLTATPYMSTPWNIYTLARHLGHNWNYLDFKQKFFTDRYIGRRVVPEVKKGIEDDIAKLVAKIGDVVRLDECVDVPPQIFEEERYLLTEHQKKGKEGIVETNPIVRYTRYHEIENGILVSDGYSGAAFFDCDKMERIRQLCIENKKIAIVCRYNLQIEAIKQMIIGSIYKDEINKNVYIIQGSTKNKDEVVQSVEREQDCIVLINAACSEGYEIPSIGVCVFASLSFSYKDYKQMCGRFLRINKLKKNVYIHLVSEGIDSQVYNAIMAKQDFDVAIYSQEHSASEIT